MFCPNCGFSMRKNFCTHCGYMRNGQFIEADKVHEHSLLEYYFGTKYDYYARNSNWLAAGILGPSYILSHNFYITGFILFFFDLALTMFMLVFNHIFVFTYLVRFFNVLFIIINRYVWASIGNMIYTKLLERKLRKVMKKNPYDYKEIIQDSYRLDNMLTGLKYFIFGSIAIISFVIAREYIYSYFFLL